MKTLKMVHESHSEMPNSCIKCKRMNKSKGCKFRLSKKQVASVGDLFYAIRSQFKGNSHTEITT